MLKMLAAGTLFFSGLRILILVSLVGAHAANEEGEPSRCGLRQASDEFEGSTWGIRWGSHAPPIHGCCWETLNTFLLMVVWWPLNC